MQVKVHDTRYVRLELLESGILVAAYKRYRIVDLDMAREIVKARFDFVGRDAFLPVMVLNLGVIYMEKDARKYVSSGDGVAGIKAAAVLLDNNLATYYIMSLIRQVEQPPMPVRKFRKRDRALEWLTTFL